LLALVWLLVWRGISLTGRAVEAVSLLLLTVAAAMPQLRRRVSDGLA
jgi:hypothetical protein